ncbi:MAG: hypothetical protein HC821_05295 [Lewinella sp.]|nr:hypothetical protein [Lewinella sp.]
MFFDLTVGGGTLVSGDFETVSWATNTYFLQVELDPNGGNAFSTLGSSQLLSVPYALYARNSGDAPQTLSFNSATNSLSISGGNAVFTRWGSWPSRSSRSSGRAWPSWPTGAHWAR